MKILHTTRRGQLGFSIIEALISVVIMGFGILSLAGMQGALSRNSDDAKQRTEAVRLAQEKIESLRSYTGISSTVVGQGTTSNTALNWNALTGSTDSITTNAVYTRTWTIGGASGDPMRGLTVSVAWTDRANEAQTISLSSVLSKTDPSDSGFLGFPLPLNTNLKRPKDRNLDIPIPAINIGNGESAVKFGTDGKYVVLNNISADIVKICTPPTLTGTSTSDQIIAALTSEDASTRNCSEITGYIVAGYVGRDGSVSNTDWDAIKNGIGIDYSGIARNAAGATGISCQFGDAVNQTTGVVITDYKYYLCVVPLAAPTPALTTSGPYNWSGTVRIAGPAVWHDSGNKYFVCRYQYVATNSLTDVNQRNVQPYVAVNKSIDQQNYLIATTSNATSTDDPTCPSSMAASGVSAAVLHQDCRSASAYDNANPATACPRLGATTQYTVTYSGNGFTGGTAPADAGSPYNTGSTVTVLGNTGALVKTGFAFSGWNTAANGSGTAYTANANFTLTANTTLYAQWTNQATYTITYNGNTNLGGTAPVDVNSPYTSGSVITVLGNTGLLTKTGYTFTGWNTAANGTGTAYAAAATFPLSANTTLYAQWYQPTYTVIYNGNTSTSGDVPTDASLYAAGATVTVQSAGTLVKTGSTFAGWNTASGGTGTTYAAGATFAITATTRLYAQWTSFTLAKPVPAWAGAVLSWPSVPNASGYLVSSCSVSGTNGLVTCTPTGSASQSSLSVTPNLNNKDTYCYTIIATGPSPYTNSSASARRCIDVQGNSYTYQ
ncbi:MAG: InlB B-repeat-containing protein [Rhodoferax sp.]|nr:InlB B-repeat-containing protein [Rhodoferax sp.]